MIEADPTMTELRGIQLSDALVITDDPRLDNVCFSNCSGMTVSVDGGWPVGLVMPADSIPYPKPEQTWWSKALKRLCTHLFVRLP